MSKAIIVAGITVLSVQDIKDDQDVIRKNLLNLDQSIHANAVQCMIHAETHGDTSLMRRLLVDIIDAKTGYRRQGLINWMRKFSPMELKQDTINLSGTDGKGNKRPFLIEEANKTPFWTDRDNAEKVVKPVFQDTLLSPIMRAYKDIMAAAENTVKGKPVDPSKPFYDGVQPDAVVDFAKAVKALADKLPADSTREIRQTQKRIAEDTLFVQANLADANPPATPDEQLLEQKVVNG